MSILKPYSNCSSYKILESPKALSSKSERDILIMLKFELSDLYLYLEFDGPNDI